MRAWGDGVRQEPGRLANHEEVRACRRWGRQFGLTLLGVALFHHHTLQVALTGLVAITIYKLGFTGFKYGTGLPGLAEHMTHEAVVLSNLFLLLMGFALLSRHFEKSRVPDEMPRFLPDDWKGG